MRLDSTAHEPVEWEAIEDGQHVHQVVLVSTRPNQLWRMLHDKNVRWSQAGDHRAAVGRPNHIAIDDSAIERRKRQAFLQNFWWKLVEDVARPTSFGLNAVKYRL